MDSKHCDFEGKISKELYSYLKNMYQMIQGNEISEELEKKLGIGELKYEDKRLKVSIYYLRWCNFIKHTIENDSNNCVNIDYYIMSNSLVEMKHLGLGYYFDVKYPKQTTILYSVGYGKDSTWKSWLEKQNSETNQIKENGMQLIFKACKEHINRGGNCRLKSMSKCFGVDLFKYMQLDENGNANIYIIKNALVNFIQINQKIFSVQDYLLSEEKFDNSVQFCIDFTNVREHKAENYNNWSKRFLKEAFISQKEFNEEKEKLGIRSEEFDSWLFTLLENERKKNGEKAIGSRVSPIVDKEVIVSDTFWEIKDGSDNIEMQDKQCYHFTFTEDEYIQLIYLYFKNYAEKKCGKNDAYFEKKISEEITRINELITSKETLSEIDKLKKINEKLSSTAELVNHIPQNIKKILETINWENEIIPRDWSSNNIYPAKNKEEKNLICNIIKCLCKNLAMK